MNPRRQYRSDLEGPDRQFGQLMAQWFTERAPASAPASLLPSVHARISATPRRSGWRVMDWWLWRPRNERGTGLLLATATGVLVMALMGVGGAGVYLLLTTGDGAPLSTVPGAAVDEPAESPAAVAVATPATADPVAAGTAPPAETRPAGSPPSLQETATPVSGTVSQAPTILDAGTTTTPEADETDIVGIVSEAVVEFDDGRLSGTQRTVEHERRLGPDAAVSTGAISIENDQGAWMGTFVSIAPPGHMGSLQQAELVGSGDYAGLSAILRFDLGLAWGDPGMVEGIVYPGSLPGYPDAEGFERYAPYRDDRERPGSSDPSRVDRAGLPAYVTGSLVQTVEWLSDDVRFSEDPHLLQLQPRWMVADMTLSDPRLEVTGYEELVDADHYGGLENGAALAAISRGTSPDGGGWAGRSRGYADPDADFLSGLYSMTELTGSGSHEGLTAILFITPRPAEASDYLFSWSVEGMLFAGELPPHPEGP